jgi:uncharacterized protein YaaW (UPF0174 family)
VALPTHCARHFVDGCALGPLQQGRSPLAALTGASRLIAAPGPVRAMLQPNSGSWSRIASAYGVSVRLLRAGSGRL